jgi:hypothetical protein
MKRLFARKVHVHYGQMYFVAHPENLPDMDECFGGQENGLCGAAMPGTLFLITGLHTGSVNVTVELCDAEPPLDDSWEEIVEVSFVVTSPTKPGIAEWGAGGWHPVKLERGTYRARYCARDMQAARDKDTVLSGEESIDSYHLSLWPAAGAKDRVLKQTSQVAAYWHESARKRPPFEWEPQW